MHFLLTATAGILNFLSEKGYAQGYPDIQRQLMSPETVISDVAGPLDGSIGGAEFGGIISFIASTIAPMVSFIALFFIVRAGFQVMASQEEGQLSKARTVIIASLTAIVLVNLVGPLSQAIYNAPGTTIDGANAASIISVEIRGIIGWLEVPLAIIAVMMIIISGIRAVINYGSDDGVTQLRQTVISVLFGLVILSIKFVVSGSVAISGEPSGFIASALRVINIILGFTALVAVAVIVIAGFYMVANIGNEDLYAKAKSLIARVAIGLIVIVSCMALANAVLLGPFG